MCRRPTEVKNQTSNSGVTIHTANSWRSVNRLLIRMNLKIWSPAVCRSVHCGLTLRLSAGYTNNWIFLIERKWVKQCNRFLHWWLEATMLVITSASPRGRSDQTVLNIVTKTWCTQYWEERASQPCYQVESTLYMFCCVTNRIGKNCF